MLYLLAAARLLLVAPYLAREAVASSRIEGTQASLSDVFEADATDAVPNADLEEVRNYIAGVRHGIAWLPDLPVSTRLLQECHGVLMFGVRGAEKTPGELRQSQNWIGAASATIADAALVPAPPEDLGPTLQAWKTYIHDPEPRLPLHIRSALLHYKFETIHPFLDGNGRLGRARPTTSGSRRCASEVRSRSGCSSSCRPSPPRQSTPSPGRRILSTCVRSSDPDFAANAAAPRR